MDVEIIKKSVARSFFDFTHLTQEPGDKINVVVGGSVIPTNRTRPISTICQYPD